jgi:hypothetical protein
MTSAYTPNKHIEQPANGDAVGSWNVPVNADWAIIDLALGGNVGINAASAPATVNLSLAQYQPLYLNFTGTLTNNVIYRLPSGVGGQWVVYNDTLGAFTLTIASLGGGANVVIGTGVRTLIMSDGINVYLSSNTITPPAGPTTSIQYNNAGALAGSSNLTWNNSINQLAVAGTVAVSSALPIVTVASSAVGSWKSYVEFDYGLVSKWQVGVDVSASGANNFYFYDSVVGAVRFFIDPSGNVGINTVTPHAKLEVSSTSDANPIALVSGASNAVRLGTSAGAALVQGVTADGSTGYAPLSIGGTSLSFTIGAALAMSIDSNSNIYPVAAASTTMTNGFFYIPAAPGAPTGVPSAVGGHVPMYYDATNNQFYIYNAGWKKVALT